MFCLVQETIVVRTAAAKRKINVFFMSTLSWLNLSEHIFAQEVIMFNSVFSSIYIQYRIYDNKNGKLWIIIEISNIMNHYKESLKITISGIGSCIEF